MNPLKISIFQAFYNWETTPFPITAWIFPNYFPKCPVEIKNQLTFNYSNNHSLFYLKHTTFSIFELVTAWRVTFLWLRRTEFRPSLGKLPSRDVRISSRSGQWRSNLISSVRACWRSKDFWAIFKRSQSKF